MKIPNIGDIVREITAIGECEDGKHLVKKSQKGRVIWVHPQNRFYVVQFRGFRESFLIR